MPRAKRRLAASGEFSVAISERDIEKLRKAEEEICESENELAAFLGTFFENVKGKIGDEDKKLAHELNENCKTRKKFYGEIYEIVIAKINASFNKKNSKGSNND